MKDMLKLENVKIVDHVKDWIDAIHVSVKPLVDQGYCESRYIDENYQKYKEIWSLLCVM